MFYILKNDIVCGWKVRLYYIYYIKINPSHIVSMPQQSDQHRPADEIEQLRRSFSPSWLDRRDKLQDNFPGSTSLDRLTNGHELYSRGRVLNMTNSSTSEFLTYHISMEPTTDIELIRRWQGIVGELAGNDDARAGIRAGFEKHLKDVDNSNDGWEQRLKPALRSINSHMSSFESPIAQDMKKLLAVDQDDGLIHGNRNPVYNYLFWLDHFAGLAEVASINNLTIPEINTTGRIHLINGRSPQIEVIDEKKCDPITIDSEGYNALSVSGINGRGKTNSMDVVASALLMSHMGGGIFADEGSEVPLMHNMGLILPKSSKDPNDGGFPSLMGGESPSDWQKFTQDLNKLLAMIKRETADGRRGIVFIDEFGGKTSFLDQAAMTIGLLKFAVDNPNITVMFTTQNPFGLEEAGELGVVKNSQVLADRRLVDGVARESGGVLEAKTQMTDVPEIPNAAEQVMSLISLEKIDKQRLGRILGISM